MPLDRATYLSQTPIVHVQKELPSRGTNLIYDDHGARRKANRTCQARRDYMRVYVCPYCQTFPPTPQATKDHDQKAT